MPGRQKEKGIEREKQGENRFKEKQN